MHPTLPSFADALALRVYRRNIGLFLQQTAQDLGLPFAALCPSPPADRHRVTVDAFGLELTLSHPHAGHTDVGDLERWLITNAKFGLIGQFGAPWSDALPMGLDPINETPDSVLAKLGEPATALSPARLAAGDRSQSYFMSDALVMALTWREGLRGLEQVWLTRLGSELVDPV